MSKDNEVELLQEQVSDLQQQLAFQENTIAELNDIVTQQMQEMVDFNKKLMLLNDKMKGLETRVGEPGAPAQERPPHY